MKVFLSLCLLVAVVNGVSIESQRRGIQMRVTDKGLSYAVQVGVGIMEKDLNNKVLPKMSGSASVANYNLYNTKLSGVDVGKYSLRTLTNKGIQVAVSDMKMRVTSRLHYKLRGFFPISDTMGMTADVKGISFVSTFKVAARPDGKPSISTLSCDADIKHLSLKFSGGAGFILNLITKMFSGKLKSYIEKMLCKEAREQVSKRTDAEMKTFSVVKNIDKWASLDYRLTSSPLFTASYMDAYIKGKFVSRKTPSATQLRIPTFQTTMADDKMVYIWLTDYTLNTAGEVYHKSGALKFTLKKDNPKVPSLLKKFMSTSALKPFMPALYNKYPNKPLRFALTSYKAPTAYIAPSGVGLKIYAQAAVQVELTPSTAVDVFTLHLDVTAKGTVAMKKEYLTGTITDTTFNATVSGSSIGKVTLPLQNPLIKTLIRVGVLQQINPLLQKGIPLPKVDDIAFTNSKIQLQQNVIRIGTDVQFTEA